MKFIFYGVILTSLLFLNVFLIYPVNAIDLKGDFRIREENKYRNIDDRRARIRFRLKGIKDLSDKTTLKFGLATGGLNQRSTNQTLGGGFETPDIRLDYVFLNYKLTKQLSFLAGKMKNPLYRPSDLLWDSDINPDGVGFSYHAKTQLQIVDVLLNVGNFVLGDGKTINDPFLFAIQPGFKLKINDNVNFQSALGVYFTENLKGQEIESDYPIAGSNNTLKEFIPIVLSSHFDIYDQLGVQIIRPYSELVVNLNESHSNKGAIIGVKFGHKKIKGWETWHYSASYRYLQSDAWLDTLPDSDAYGGKTNAKGLEIEFTFGLTKALSWGLDVYYMSQIIGGDSNELLIQTDLNVKF